LDYRDNASGEILATQSATLDPSRIFITDEKLDFTVITSPTSPIEAVIIDYPWMKLMADIGKTDVGDSVNIIQHPEGRLKQIAFPRKVIAIPQDNRNFFYYTTDTEPGSSDLPASTIRGTRRAASLRVPRWMPRIY
jgi:endonuclease G